MKVDMSFIPDAKLGEWRIETFEVNKNELSEYISLMKTGRGVPSGIYKRLMRNNTCVMSNTPDEINDFSGFVWKASGVVLINGLGLGCLVKALLDKKEITKVIVIEIDENVINLVYPYFKDDRLTVINANAYDYKPPKGEKYDYVWHDIWDYISPDNLRQMEKLHRKYAKRVNKYQDSWCKRRCLYQKQKGN